MNWLEAKYKCECTEIMNETFGTYCKSCLEWVKENE